jgi:DNA polymerase III alpha subunit (gram-positive type)
MGYFLSIDVETTGINENNNSIVEIAAILYNDREKVLTYQDHIFPEAKIDLGALKVNKLDFKKLGLSIPGGMGFDFSNRNSSEAGSKLFCDWLLNHVIPIAGNKITILGHSVEFDIRFIKKWLYIHDITGWENIFDHNTIDTKGISNFLKQAGKLNIPHISLNNLAKALEIEVTADKLHSAIYDCELAANCYFKMLDLVKGE